MDRDDVKAIMLTGTGGKFCGGFDIDVFTEVHKTGKWPCHRLAASVPQHLPESPPLSLDTAATSADSIRVCIVGRNLDNDDQGTVGYTVLTFVNNMEHWRQCGG